MKPFRATTFKILVPCIAACLMVFGTPSFAQTQEPPSAVVAPAELAAYGAGWRAAGSGVLRFFGFKAYDATLWLPSANAPFAFTRPFALEIRYATRIKGRDISNTSLIELQRISASSPEQIVAWGAWMDATFTDVKAGDQLIGVHVPGNGARFFLNGRLIGETQDTAFSEAFFKIWLDPKTKRPDLRAALLAQDAPPKP
ncbi:chalcone isomerase family protein [Rhodoferax aquaticus]|nr:chalcone isomerase family protein [Rhodoferax aquaticus]